MVVINMLKNVKKASCTRATYRVCYVLDLGEQYLLLPQCFQKSSAAEALY